MMHICEKNNYVYYCGIYSDPRATNASHSSTIQWDYLIIIYTTQVEMQFFQIQKSSITMGRMEMTMSMEGDPVPALI